MARFLRRRLARVGRRADNAEDVASCAVTRLLERPPSPPLAEPDLVGLYKLLSVRALQALRDGISDDEGKMRCGNCRHIRREPGKVYRCTHPSPNHFWTGKQIRASIDPRHLVPPCDAYLSGRAQDELPDGLSGEGYEQENGLVSRDLLVKALARVAKRNPQAAQVVYLVFFEDKDVDEIASQVRVSGRTVRRRREEGLALMRSELESLGRDAA